MNIDLNERLKQYQRNYYVSKKKKCFYCIKMISQTSKFGDIVVNKNFMLLNKQLL